MQEYFEIYKGYKLICTPTAIPDGLYRTRLIIQKDNRSEIEVFKISIMPHTCTSVEEAANVARNAGRMWVDNNS